MRFFAKYGRLFFLLTGSLTGTACYFGQYSGYTHSLPSVGSDTSSPDEDFFYLDLDESFYDTLGIEPPLYELNTTEDYGPSERRDSVSNCEILYDEDEPSDPEIICILDYMEQEFLTYDLAIVVNVPRGMCTNFITYPAWHYNRPAGSGPTLLYYFEADEESEDEDEYCLTDSNVRSAICSTDPIKLCPFRYSRDGAEEGEQDNCCIGSYATVGGEDSGEEPWGGNIQNCLGGPGRTSWDFYDRNGFPGRRVEYILEDGLRRTIEITNLIEVARGGSHSTPIANYIEYLNEPVDDLLDRNNVLPQFYTAHNNPSWGSNLPPANTLPTGNPFFSFSCLDSAGDTLQRIDLMIREWNTYEEFITFLDSGGGDESADPDVPGKATEAAGLGIEGDHCEYEERLSLIPGENHCNDYLDLDDVGDLYPNARYGGQ